MNNLVLNPFITFIKEYINKDFIDWFNINVKSDINVFLTDKESNYQKYVFLAYIADKLDIHLKHNNNNTTIEVVIKKALDKINNPF